ncbi:HD domain-containing phosphohydrolase [Marinobacterium lutimaris]|uniref:HAMP domain-containing protein n=1 Tax=Marinobacterium lutimaris TaxID=568106 RepID=A0A1H6DAI4_9GAMM|nr:HD domain-containing phosphohydrolase [Marinobacterium lutimaris]SEG82202.1 HAMP domain-containing protein [Marinobacterium lutimaris]
MDGRRFHFPLQVLVSGTIVVSMFVLALVLIGGSYYGQRETLLNESGTRAEQLAESLDTHIDALLSPVKSTVQMLSRDPIAEAPNLAARRARLPVLVTALGTSSLLSSVYVGYSDGSFVLLRRLRYTPVKESVSAPKDAAYLLQSIERGAFNQIDNALWEFYDADLKLLETRDKPDYDYDPRSRPWYASAAVTTDTVLTSPYIFYTTAEIGVTLAQRSESGAAVIGVDASVNDFSSVIGLLRGQSQAEIAIVTPNDQVVAYSDILRVVRDDPDDGLRLAYIDEVGVPILTRLSDYGIGSGMQRLDIDGRRWLGFVEEMRTGGEGITRLLFAIPADALLADAKKQSLQLILWSVLVMLVLLLLGSWGGRLVTKPLKRLSEQVSALAQFDFSKGVPKKSRVDEVRRLSELIGQMSGAINGFQKISHLLAHERDLEKMLHRVTRELVTITSAASGAVYLYDEDEKILQRATNSGLRSAPEQLSAGDAGPEELRARLREQLARQGEAVMTTLLRDRNGDLLGILALVLLPEHAEYEDSYQKFVDEVSGSAATAIDTQRQVDAQNELIESIIRLLADAIDAKSAYTSGHCDRVPQLAEMLVDAAEASDDKAFAAFRMNEQQRREFRIAAWLHDCGKVTSPEYVVDKATKLETQYDRIHEIRTRFEVLWRDAEIAYLRGIVKGGVEADLRAQRDQLRKKLRQEFALVAKSNVGGEFMPDEDIEKLQQIGRRRWKRYFDKRLGISRDELERLPEELEELPVIEYLLADRPEHLIPWGDRRPPVENGDPNNTWGFDMTLPDYAANHGELYNLSIQKGTLTDEERFAINDHIVQTIRMLTSLPLPKELRRIPDIAGNHHEKIDGTGYPRGLAAGKLSVEERIMAVADVFEALTAADRPYKDAKTLSESLRILAFMVKDRHLDADLFRLFLESGIYLRYAERFLKPEQIDKVDRRQLLTLAGLG